MAHKKHSLACLLGVLLAAMWPLSTPAQSVNSMPLEEVYSQSKHLMNAREFARARTFMAEMVKRLASYEEDNNTAKLMLEWASFHMGLAGLESKQYQAGIKDLTSYRAKYGRSGQWYSQATILLANGYVLTEQWQKCITTAEDVANDRSLNANDRLICFQLIAESYYRLQKWEEAISPNAYVFKNHPGLEARNDAAIKLLNCYVKLDRMQDLFQFLPVVDRTDARFDIEFNLSLIEAGDRNFDEERFNNAIMLYRLVYTKPQLVEAVQVRLRNVRNQIERFRRSGLDSNSSATMQRFQRMEKDLIAQLKRLEEYPEYNQEVIIRSARTYLELEMYWEALTQFRHVFEKYPEHALAEESLYAAFSTALQMEKIDRVMIEGYDYVTHFPAGNFWDTVTVVLMQLHVQREEYQQCLDLGRTALDKKPDHSKADNVEYLIGFCLFQLDRVEDAQVQFKRVINTYPDSFYKEYAEYWHALAQLFQANYTAAREEFEKFVAAYKTGPFVEDASFRVGVAYYGENNFEKSEEFIARFVEKFPDSELQGEALYMLADIYASWALLDKAVEYYRRVPDVALNMVQINYATFQVAKTLELEGRWDEIIELFHNYKLEYKHHANFTEATYWIGTANIQKGDIPTAMNVFLDAIVKWGDVPENYGIDMIVRDLIAQSEQFRGTEPFDNLMQRLYKALDVARDKDQKTLELRLMAFFAGVEQDVALKNRLISSLLRERHIPIAGPITLQLMGRYAEEQGDEPFALKVYSHFVETHPKSDLNMEAMKGVARSHIKRQEWDQSTTMLNEIITKYPMYPDAGWAKKTIADVYRLQGEWDTAIAEYETVLAVKEWKGDGSLWAEANYWIGVCHMEKGLTREAHNYFQRIYVLYEAHLTWAAQAYIKAGECLAQLGKRDEAKNTLREFLNRPDVENTEWKTKVQMRLAEMGGA